MPAFEDNDLKRGEPMPEQLKDDFLAKRKRLAEKRKQEIAELEAMFKEDDDGESVNQVDGS